MGSKEKKSGLSAFRRRYKCVASRAISSVLDGLDGDYPAGVADLLERKLFVDVVSLEIDPRLYREDQSDEFRDDYFASEVLSKYPGFPLGIDKAKVALDKFIDMEARCLETNNRLSRRYVNGITSRVTPESVFNSAREKIARLLGPFSWDQAEQFFAFGPHASTRCKRQYGDAYYKYGASHPHSTSNCAIAGLTAIYREPRWFLHLARLSGLFQTWFDAVPRDDQLSRSSELLTEVRQMDIHRQVEVFIRIVDGNRVATVAKNAKTDRIIAIEPDLNMYLQTGVGALIRRALRHAKVDLNDQTRNQRLAKLGSRYGALATLDLSSASDTVSLRLVEELMPPDWYTAISICRSQKGVMPDGSLKNYQKVSSMGNGFTFELESLIFWALTSSVQDHLRPAIRCVSIYGDDVICPVEIAPTVKWIFEYAGFLVNAKKSHMDGGFRESCGKHYFFGRDVTPFYVREPVVSIHRLFWLANQIRRWARRSCYLDGRVKAAYDSVVALIPSNLRRPSIPDGLGDIALFGDLDECAPRRYRQNVSSRNPLGNAGFDAWLARGYVEEAKASHVPDDDPYLIRQLEKLAGNRGVFDPVRKVTVPRENVVPLGDVRSPIVVRPCEPLVHQWESYGPWA